MTDFSFEDRLSRIRNERRRNVIHVGDETYRVRAARRGPPPSRSQRVLNNAALAIRAGVAFILSLFGAVALAVAGSVLATAIRMQVLPVRPWETLGDMHLAICGVLGMVLAYIFAQIFRLHCDRWRLGLMALAVVVSTCGMHNLAHWAPVLSEQTFTKTWLMIELAQTRPNSLRLLDFELSL